MSFKSCKKKGFDFDLKYDGKNSKKKNNNILHTAVGFRKLQVWEVKYGRTFLDIFHEIHLKKSLSSNIK